MRFVLKKIGNIVWKLFGGIAFSVLWYALGVVFTLSVFGFPLAMSCFRVGRLVWKPFGKGTVIALTEYPLSNIVWGFSIGLLLGFLALSSCIVTAVTIIGLPLSKQWLKVAKVSVFPFGVYIK